MSQTSSVCAECRWCYLVLLSADTKPITLSLLLFLQVLLHNYLISSLLKQHLESEHLRHIGAGPFTPNPSLSLNAPFCPLHNYHSERMPSTPKRAKKIAAVWATALHAHPSLDCRVIPRRNHNCTMPCNCAVKI